MPNTTLKLAVLLALVGTLTMPVTFAGDPNPKVAEAITAIEARRAEKLDAEAKSVQARAEETPENGGWGGRQKKAWAETANTAAARSQWRRRSSARRGKVKSASNFSFESRGVPHASRHASVAVFAGLFVERRKLALSARGFWGGRSGGAARSACSLGGRADSRSSPASQRLVPRLYRPQRLRPHRHPRRQRWNNRSMCWKARWPKDSAGWTGKWPAWPCRATKKQD